MIQLLNLHTFGSLGLLPHSKGYWQASKAFAAIQECDDGRNYREEYEEAAKRG